MRRGVASALGLAALAAIVIVASSGGSSPYRVRVMLTDAAGLRQRSPVMIGGVPAGTVTLRLGHDDQVNATLELDPSQAPVGKDASVAISAVNFLGQKEALLTRGNLADPAPSGYLIPASRVTVATDLDQVLDVLDASTRARLALLIDEAGTALTGRKADFSLLLQQLPHALTDANGLLRQMVSDNHTLADLVTSSDQFVSAIAAQRSQLSGMIDAAGQAAVTFAGRRDALAQTLARAPATLITAQQFLARLKAATVPLGPAAANITAAAPALSSTLAQVEPFQRAAQPALSAAIGVAPELTQLATGATPVLTQANPVVNQLATFGLALQPVSHILNHSVDNLLAVVDNWARAIQYRDGLSHVFRGAGGFTPDALDSVISRALKPGPAASALSATLATIPAPPVQPSAPARPHSARRHLAPGAAPAAVSGLLGKLRGLLGGGAPTPSSAPPSLSSLLNYLLKP
jgi:phospholipid/cholesterol/gamma-HCH transport system substrate-binding protein